MWNHKWPKTPWESPIGPSARERQEMLYLAQIAFETLREPTEAMLKAKMSLGGYGFADGECFSADPKEIWQAMLAEAIK